MIVVTLSDEGLCDRLTVSRRRAVIRPGTLSPKPRNERRLRTYSMLAIRRQCSVIITCDERTNLRHRTEIEAEFSIRLLLPPELVREILAAHP